MDLRGAPLVILLLLVPMGCGERGQTELSPSSPRPSTEMGSTQQAAINVPNCQRYNLDITFSMTQARESNTMLAPQPCDATPRMGSKGEPVIGKGQYRCTVEGDLLSFHPPYPPWLGEPEGPPVPSACEMRGQLAYERAWAPASEVKDGWALARRLAALAESGTLVAPQGISECARDAHACAEYLLSSSSDNVPMLLRCRAEMADGQRGAPTFCEPAVMLDAEPWLLILKNAAFCTSDWRAFASEVADIEIANANFSLEDTMAAIEEVLRTKLGYKTQFIPANARHLLRATSFRRPSPILKGLREEATIHVHGSQQDKNAIRLYVGLDLLVNEQATADASDWHKPEAAQSKTYIEAIEKEIGTSIKLLCKPPRALKSSDSKTYRCE